MIRKVVVNPKSMWFKFQKVKNEFWFCTWKDYIKLKGYIDVEKIMDASKKKMVRLEVRQTVSGK